LASSDGEEQTMSRLRILVVDDDELVLKSCARTLAEIRGAEVVKQELGCRASELLKKESFDLLISDIRVPGVSGLELLEIAHKQNPRLPVILITGFPPNEALKGCHSLGAAACLMKPIRPEELLAAVHQVLDRRGVTALS
jgi:two-component system response regulator YesN